MDVIIPVGSRRQTRRQDRRDLIVTVARASFLGRGYAGTTMSSVAATLGGSKGTLWRYFPSKEALFEAVIDQATIEFRARLTEALRPCGDAAATLRRFGMDFLTKVTSPDAIALHRLVVAESGRFPETGAIFHNRAKRRTLALLTGFLAGAMQAGQLRQDDPSHAAQVFVTLLTAGSHQRLLIGLACEASTDEVVADVEDALTIFLRAFAPADAPAAMA